MQASRGAGGKPLLCPHHLVCSECDWTTSVELISEEMGSLPNLLVDPGPGVGPSSNQEGWGSHMQKAGMGRWEQGACESSLGETEPCSDS